MSKKPAVPVATRKTDTLYEVTVNWHQVHTAQLRVRAANSKDAARLAEATAAEHQKLFDQTDAHSCSFQALGSRPLPDPAVRLAVSNAGMAAE